MIGTLQQIYEDMEHGVYDFTKDEKCSSCGACCSNYLPLSSGEIKEIKRFFSKIIATGTNYRQRLGGLKYDKRR